MVHVHRYRAALSWSGSTAGGYRAYSRTHRVEAGPNALQISADPAFGGDPALPDPEQLLLAAATSCQLLSFLALAAREGIDVRDYADEAEARMPAARAESMGITEIVLRPRIVVAAGTDPDRVEELVRLGHEQCFIANTLTCDMRIEASVTLAV